MVDQRATGEMRRVIVGPDDTGRVDDHRVEPALDPGADLGFYGRRGSGEFPGNIYRVFAGAERVKEPAALAQELGEVPEERLPWLNSLVFRGMTAMPLRVSEA